MKKRKTLNLIILASVLALIILVVALTPETDNSSEDLCVEAYVASQKVVKDQLTNPSSADFPFFDFGCSQTDSVTWLIKASVESSNAFGGTVEHKYSVYMISSGESWISSGLEFY